MTLRLYNTLTGMVIVYTAWNIPLVVWLLKGFSDEIPREYEEAALIGERRNAGHVRAQHDALVELDEPGSVGERGRRRVGSRLRGPHHR